MAFISVDIEASGPIPGVYDLLSFGAVRVRKVEGRYVPLEDELYVELKPHYGGVDPGAMKVNKLDLKRLEAEGQTFEAAARQIRDWVKKGARSKEPAIFVGYCANFDWSFVNDLFLRTNTENPFGYKALDIRALAMGVLKLPWLDLTQTTILPRLGLEPLSEAVAHNALADARHQAQMLCRLLELGGLEEAEKVRKGRRGK